MKSNAIGNRINTCLFDLSSGAFTADVSMLHDCNLDIEDQLYHDEGTKGFVMVSQWTGNEVEMKLYHTDREADHDIRFWVFKPSAAAIARDPRVAKVKVTVYNT